MRTKLSLAAAAAVFLFAPSIGAQVANPDARVDLRVEGRALSDVVGFLREQSGANLVVLAGGDQLVSLEITDVPWREALELAAEQCGCIVSERKAGVLVIEKPIPVTFDFPNGDIRAVIDTIAKVSGANIVVSPDVQGTISVRVQDVPWRGVLDSVVKTLGFVVVEDTRGMLRVVDPATLQAQLETRSYQLRYLRPPGTYVPRVQSEFILGQSKPPTGDLAKDFPIIDALRKALTDGGELDYVAAQNVIIVRDTTQVQDAIRDILSRLDVEPAQVFIDVKFVSTTNGDLLDIGVDYGASGPTVSISGSQIPITFPFQQGEGGFEDGLIAGLDEVDGPFFNPATNGGEVVAPATIFGALNFTGFAATLRMLQTDSRTEVVQAPKILALDGREATIFVGETIRYAEAKTEQGQAGGFLLAITEANNSPVEVGFQLLLTPHVVPGTNKLTLDVIPKETSLSGTGDSELAPPGFDVFTVGAQGLEGSIALPRKRSSTIVTSMLLDSGQPAVIGGLTTDQDIETHAEVPYLADIPILGELFQYDKNTRDRRNLLVFLTPTIVRSSFEQRRLLELELERRRDAYSSSLRELLLSDVSLSSDAAPAAQ
jgi:type IV pilus assembly protein PilQ